jgi:hypothetical protein
MPLAGRVLGEHVAPGTHPPLRTIPGFILHLSLEIEDPLALGAGMPVSNEPGRYDEKRIG